MTAPEDPIFCAIELGASQAYQAAQSVLRRMERPPSVPYHSAPQASFAQAITDCCRGFTKRLDEKMEALVAEYDWRDDLYKKNTLLECKRILLDLETLDRYVRGIVDVDVFDIPSPLILWIQRTFERLLPGEQLIVGHTDEDTFAVFEGTGQELKLGPSRRKVLVSGPWSLGACRSLESERVTPSAL